VWLTLAYLPIAPLRSVRLIRRVQANYTGGVSPRHYFVAEIEPAPLYWPHVAWGYALTVGALLIATGLDPRTRDLELEHPLATAALGSVASAWLALAGWSRWRDSRGRETTASPGPDARR
jgi:hypothetical protein